MKLSRLHVRNFRNLRDVDIALDDSVVIVGENGAGKSNLVYALRLVLDGSLSATDRRLTSDDFWRAPTVVGAAPADISGAPSGMDRIEIAVEFVAFEKSAPESAMFSKALVNTTPPTARVTYVWEPDPDVDQEESVIYRQRVFLGKDVETSASRAISRINLSFLQALRDVESDIRSWRRSPLRELLDEITSQLTVDETNEILEQLKRANAALGQIEGIKSLADQISERTEDLAGARQKLSSSLMATPTELGHLIRSLQIYVDGDSLRPLSAASLGALNVLYFALLEINRTRRLASREILHGILVIEEPEAHLHPHLQRSVTTQLSIENDVARSLIITTHSPQIVSAAPIRDIVRLAKGEQGSQAHSARAAALSEKEWADVGRYIDATRADLVFSSAVIFVEGFAEQVLVPALASSMGYDLDKLGISVCAIHGVHFSAYVKLAEALGIPWVLVTDGDAGVGASRVSKLADECVNPAEARARMFVGTTTFEDDLLRSSAVNLAAVRDALLDLLAVGSKYHTIVGQWTVDDPPPMDVLMKAIKATGGKGRFAQRLSARNIEAFGYLHSAIEKVVGS